MLLECQSFAAGSRRSGRFLADPGGLEPHSGFRMAIATMTMSGCRTTSATIRHIAALQQTFLDSLELEAALRYSLVEWSHSRLSP